MIILSRISEKGRYRWVLASLAGFFQVLTVSDKRVKSEKLKVFRVLLEFSHPIGELISGYTIVGFVCIHGFLRIVRKDISDLHLRVAIGSL
jgi:hypothetical protein